MLEKGWEARKILDAKVDWEGGMAEEMERRWVRGEQGEQVCVWGGGFWGQKEERQWTTV